MINLILLFLTILILQFFDENYTKQYLRIHYRLNNKYKFNLSNINEYFCIATNRFSNRFIII